MLTESQIQRYSRQILLREVGGVGQERLLSTPVDVSGTGVAFDVIRQTLLAGGSPLESNAALRVAAEAPADVLVRPTFVAVGCRSCLGALVGGEAPSADNDVLVGALGALAAQRLVLGALPGPVVVFTVGPHGLKTETPPCPHAFTAR